MNVAGMAAHSLHGRESRFLSGVARQQPATWLHSATVRLARMELYHVRVSVAGQNHDEVKLDLSRDQLNEQFLEPYGLGLPFTVNGRVVQTSDLERLRVSTSVGPARTFLPKIKAREAASGVFVLGGPSNAWKMANYAEDVTDDLIKGPPGWNRDSVATATDDDAKVRRVTVPSGPGDQRSVFLVHGRNIEIANAMKEFLRSLDLRIIEWEQAVGLTGEPNPYIGDVITSGLEAADGIVVLATPDDIVKLDPNLVANTEDPELIEARQPRQNVIYEAGMAMALAPNRTLVIATPGTKILSDLSGRHLAYLDDSSQARKRILGRLQTIGLSIDDSGHGWLDAGDFGEQ